MSEPIGPTRATRHKNFYRELDSILRSIDEEQGLESMLTTILSQVGGQVLRSETGISSGRLYRRDDDHYVEYDRRSRTAEGVQEHLDRWVRVDRDTYLSMIDQRHLANA